jgi:hypothetical protein
MIILVQSCTERAICPAYQSAFIHDKKALEKRFSYFGEDSMPKVLEASKDRFLIIEPVSYRRKLRSLQTIPMTDVYPEVEDSVAFDDEFYLAERDLSEIEATDSAAKSLQDSVYVISLKKEKFNVDQELYLWYLKDYLVYPDVRILQEAEMKANTPPVVKEKKGFFRRLFGKKDKGEEMPADSTSLDGEQKEKKGLFNFLKKKKKDDPELTAPKEEQPSGSSEDPSTKPSTPPAPLREPGD